MRTFYIFKIKKEMAILTKDTPYNIFKNMEGLKKLVKDNISTSYNIYDQIITPINNKSFNQHILKNYKDNLYYQKYYNIHTIYNKYKPENTKLVIKNTYLLLETNAIKPSFLKELAFDKDLFVCDFENKDYFWIEQVI